MSAAQILATEDGHRPHELVLAELVPILELAARALESSEPALKHYAEPNKRHYAALKAVRDAVEKYKGGV